MIANCKNLFSKVGPTLWVTLQKTSLLNPFALISCGMLDQDFVKGNFILNHTTMAILMIGS